MTIRVITIHDRTIYTFVEEENIKYIVEISGRLNSFKIINFVGGLTSFNRILADSIENKRSLRQGQVPNLFELVAPFNGTPI